MQKLKDIFINKIYYYKILLKKTNIIKRTVAHLFPKYLIQISIILAQDRAASLSTELADLNRRSTEPVLPNNLIQLINNVRICIINAGKEKRKMMERTLELAEKFQSRSVSEPEQKRGPGRPPTKKESIPRGQSSILSFLN